MNEITVADWKRQGVELRERLEAERDTLRHRLDQVQADIIEIDRTLGNRPTPAPKAPVTRVAETIVKRNGVGTTANSIADGTWIGSLAGAIRHVMRERKTMARGELVDRICRMANAPYDQVQSNISALAKSGGMLRLEGTRGAMTVHWVERANGTAEMVE